MAQVQDEQSSTCSLRAQLLEMLSLPYMPLRAASSLIFHRHLRRCVKILLKILMLQIQLQSLACAVEVVVHCEGCAFLNAQAKPPRPVLSARRVVKVRTL